jgi:pilin/secretion family protein with methylation motif
MQLMKTSAPKTNNKAGFSLLEVLAALVLTTLLMVSLTPLVRQMLATWWRGSDVAGLVEFQIRGVAALKHDMVSSIVWTGSGGADDGLFFRGNETSLSFPAITKYGNGQDRLEMISVEIANSSDGHAVIRRHSPILGSNFSPPADPLILFSGPYRYFFRYYGPDNRESIFWDNREHPPARIAVNVVDSSGQLAAIPIEIPVVASMSAACVQNANLPGCAALPKPPDDNADDSAAPFK